MKNKINMVMKNEKYNNNKKNDDNNKRQHKNK